MISDNYEINEPPVKDTWRPSSLTFVPRLDYRDPGL